MHSSLPTVFCVVCVSLSLVIGIRVKSQVFRELSSKDRSINRLPTETGTTKEMMMWDVLMRLDGRTETLDRVKRGSIGGG